MNVDTRDMISVTEVSNKGVSKYVTAAEEGRPQVLVRNNRAVAAIVSVEELDRLQRVDELEDDVRLLSIALARAAADSGRRYGLDEVVEELGIDPGELEED